MELHDLGLQLSDLLELVGVRDCLPLDLVFLLLILLLQDIICAFQLLETILLLLDGGLLLLQHLLVHQRRFFLTLNIVSLFSCLALFGALLRLLERLLPFHRLLL